MEPTAGNITALTAQLDYPDVIEKQNDVSISAAGTAVALTKTFRAVSSVSITALQTGPRQTIRRQWRMRRQKARVQLRLSAGTRLAPWLPEEVDITVIGY